MWLKVTPQSVSSFQSCWPACSQHDAPGPPILDWGQTPAVMARLPQPLRHWCEGSRALPAVQLLEQPAAPPADPLPKAEGDDDAPPPPPLASDGCYAVLPITWSPLMRQPKAEGGGCLGDEVGITTLGDLLLRRCVEQLQPANPAARLFGRALDDSGAAGVRAPP